MGRVLPIEHLRFAARTADAAERCDRLAGRDFGVDGRTTPLPALHDTVRASVTVAGGRSALFGGLAGPLRGGWGEAAPRRSGGFNSGGVDMKRLGRAIEQVLYIVWRDWRDWYAFAWFFVFVAAVFGLGSAIWTTVKEYTAHDWHVFGVYVLSEFLQFLPFTSGKTKKIRDLDGEVLVWTIEAITRHGYILDLRDRMLGDALVAALWGAGAGAGLLIGTVVVLRIVHWRNSSRRRGAGEKRAALSLRGRIGLSFHRMLRVLPAPVRLVRRTAKGYAHSGSVERGDANSTVGKYHAAGGAAEGAAAGPARRRRIPAVPAAFDKLTVKLFQLTRSVRQGRTDGAEAPRGQAPLQCDQRADNKACDDPSGSRLPATSTSVPTASAPAVLEASANPNRSKLSSRLSHSPEQVSFGVQATEDEDGGPPRTGPSQEHRDAARDEVSEGGPSPEPQGEGGASADRMPGSGDRPLPAASRHGRGRRRRKASQDFY